MSDTASKLHTRPSLLLRLRDLQDAAAWQTFTEVYAPLLYRWCRRHGLQEADAADVSQDVLAQVAKSIRSFEYQPDRGKFRNWLGVVLRSKLARFQGKEARAVRGTGSSTAQLALHEAAAPDADSEWTASFNAHLVRIALDRIRPNFDAANWRAFERVWLDDCPAADVAKELAMPPTRVYVAKSRILKRLREEIRLLAEDLPSLTSDADAGR